MQLFSRQAQLFSRRYTSAVTRNVAASLLAVLSAIQQNIPQIMLSPSPSLGQRGKGQFHQLAKCLDVKEAIGSPHHHVLKCYDVFIRMEPANHARSFLLCQGTVESNIYLASLWFAFDRLCPTVDWVVDFAVVDHCR